MKQSISVEQHKSLSPTAQLKWKAYCVEHGYGSAFAVDEFVEDAQPSIGILIEFLGDKFETLTYEEDVPLYKVWVSSNVYINMELIDALYEPWKEILESD